ncbi:hypothetical protein [Nocardia abscessus]|uniref:hypothetical protein n=1 Tax=Nocardia abscessus TaxID=120957 RepID=UPI0005BAB99A|nr:hypothetical protein [Nocardia abscessus]
MADVRRVEVDGLRASWCVSEGHLISIIAVHKASAAAPVVSFGPEIYPDLVQARELLPGLVKLWDAVRHDFWNQYIPAHPRSRTREDGTTSGFLSDTGVADGSVS